MTDRRRVSIRGVKTDIGLLILRGSTGFLMLFAHGARKLSRYPELSDSFSDPLGIGSQASLTLTIGAEVVASIFLILGVFTRVSTLPLLFAMCIAFFVVHSGDPFPVREKAVLFGMSYVVLLFTGPGRFSVDRALANRFRNYPRFLQ